MRTLCPNFDREDGLETVLEVPIPEEMFPSAKNKWPNMKSWMKPNPGRTPATLPFADRNSQIQLLLGVIGAPLIPLPIPSDHKVTKCIKDHPIVSFNKPVHCFFLFFFPGFLLHTKCLIKCLNEQVLCSFKVFFIGVCKLIVMCSMKCLTGIFDGEIHYSSVHCSDGRGARIELDRQHVCYGKGEDDGIRIQCW